MARDANVTVACSDVQLRILGTRPSPINRSCGNFPAIGIALTPSLLETYPHARISNGAGNNMRISTGCFAAALAVALSGCASEAPPREPVFTDARALVAGPAKPVGEDCTNTGKDGCDTGVCLKVEPGSPGRYVCSAMCAPNGSRPCPQGWACLQVRPTGDGFACIPPANWQPRATVLAAAAVRVAPVLPLIPAPASKDGGRP